MEKKKKNIKWVTERDIKSFVVFSSKGRRIGIKIADGEFFMEVSEDKKETAKLMNYLRKLQKK